MRLWLLVPVAVGLTSCGALPFPAYERSSDAARRAELVRAAPAAPPTAALVSLRVTIARDSAEHALTLHGVVFPSGALYLQGINDFGGGACALGRDAHAAGRFPAPAGMPTDAWDTLGDALALAFAPPPAAGVELVRLREGAWALLARRDGEETLMEPRGDAAGVRYDVGRDGTWRVTVACEGAFRDAADRPVCPRRIDIASRQADVRASAEVFAWEPSHADEIELGREFEQSFGGR